MRRLLLLVLPLTFAACYPALHQDGAGRRAARPNRAPERDLGAELHTAGPTQE